MSINITENILKHYVYAEIVIIGALFQHLNHKIKDIKYNFSLLNFKQFISDLRLKRRCTG